MRIVGTVGIILYGFAAVYTGIAQQRLGLRADAIDCAYRVQLLRDRMVALLERSHRLAGGDPQEHVISNLLRETRAACAADDAHTAQLEEFERRLEAFRRHRALEAEAADALLAL